MKGRINMKRKIRVRLKDKTTEGEYEIAGKDHLYAQQCYKSTIQKNKKKYDRKRDKKVEF